MKKVYIPKNREQYLLGRKKYNESVRFGGNKIKALTRDGYICQRCGMTNEQHHLKWGSELTVDHIDGRGRGSKNPNHALENLITLCFHCHGIKDRARLIRSRRKNSETERDYKSL